MLANETPEAGTQWPDCGGTFADAPCGRVERSDELAERTSAEPMAGTDKSPASSGSADGGRLFWPSFDVDDGLDDGTE